MADTHRRRPFCEKCFAGFALSCIGLALALATGWLGGELVDRLGNGVEDDANPNAPSSLSGRPVAGPDQGAHRL
jgi:hypothetical protein